MEVQNSIYRFDRAVACLPTRLREVLTSLPGSVKSSVFEIRLRVDKPVALTCPNRSWFVDSAGQLHNIPGHCFSVTPHEIEQAVLTMCSYSVHAHQNEMKNGFISLRGGHRAGICGTAVLSDGKVSAVRDITSINLRIARDIKGAATEVMRKAFADKLCGVLIVGPPSSGKTTILRDLARQLAGGEGKRCFKVAVVDERCEIGAVHEGVPQNDLGPGCDILSGYPKGEGLMIAIRTLSPQVIICDEIGGEEDVNGMLDGLRCGVKIVASAHAESVKELLCRRQITRLLVEGAFQRIIMLGTADEPGKVVETVGMEDLRYEGGRFIVDRPVLFHDGDVHGIDFIGQGSHS